MTNLVISLVLVTNWTGVNFQQQELGYVTTNHVATLTYQNTTNQFTLKMDPSDKAAWRPAGNVFISTKWIPSIVNTSIYTIYPN